jgi:hypothetical protein
MALEHRGKLPGFTAESSLGGGEFYYAARLNRLRSPKAGPSTAVVPQVRVWWPGDCIPGCVCVQDEGCPCCGYGGNPPFPRFPWPLRQVST